jgi:O-antigen/teichoic acid export membrane protein
MSAGLTVRKVFESILRLGIGEGIAKLSALGLYAYISRAFGVELLGIVALSQTIAAYVIMGTDQGLRLIGARLVAQDPSVAPTIILPIVRKRIASCAACVLLACIYAMRGPVPQQARLYVLGFALAVIPYAFSLDWLAWGLNHLGWLGAWRAIVSLSFTLTAVLGIYLCHTTLLPITISNGVSVILGALLLWVMWHFRWKRHLGPAAISDSIVVKQVRWATVFPLGMATILTLMFHNFDTVMLAGMTSVGELGRYSAAYKVLFAIFSAYYLFTQSLYPKLAAMKTGTARLLFGKVIGGVALLGSGIALALATWDTSILRIIYGSDLNASHLLRILSLAVPMDFCSAFMGIVCVSRGFDKVVMKCAGAAAISDILANLWLIPRFGASGAAWSTLISYVILVSALAIAIFNVGILRESSEAIAGEVAKGWA